MYQGFYTNVKQTVFNCDNNMKCFLRFLKDHVDTETEVMMLKIQLCIRNKLHFKIYKTVYNNNNNINFTILLFYCIFD